MVYLLHEPPIQIWKLNQQKTIYQVLCLVQYGLLWKHREDSNPDNKKDSDHFPRGQNALSPNISFSLKISLNLITLLWY